MLDAIVTEHNQHIFSITFNRVEKHNAFDDAFIEALHYALIEAENNKNVRLVVLKARGAHFSAGADLNWMQRMAHMTEAENTEDAEKLAKLLHTLYHLKKPTLALVQGSAFGGGVGLIAATDIVLASASARFCFSEVKLGLIPAVISPYVIEAIGARAAGWLFMSGDVFDAQKALELQLIHQVIPDDLFQVQATQYLTSLSQLPPEALQLSKQLIRQVKGHPIDDALQTLTATLIAKRRVSKEGQQGIQTFLNKHN